MELIALGDVYLRRLAAIPLILLFSSTFAFAQKPVSDEYIKERLFSERFKRFADEQRSKHGNSWPNHVYLDSEILTDRLTHDILNERFVHPLHRDDIADQALDVLVRGRGKYPVLVGEAGAGKTAVTEVVAYKLLTNDFPTTQAYKDELEDAVILRVSARKFLPGGQDISAWLNTIPFLRQRLERKIIVQIFECQFLEDYAIGVLRELADARDKSVPVILETDSKSFSTKIKGHPSFATISRAIQVPSTTGPQTKSIIKEQLLPKLESRFGVMITDEVLDIILDVSKDYGREAAEPLRSLQLTEEFAIDWQRRDGGPAPTKVDLYRFVARRAGLRVIPQNEQEFSSYMEELRDRVKARVVAQDAIVDGLIDQFRAALTSRTRQHSVAMITGPTGVGKTLSAEVLAEEFYGDKTRVLEIDMTQFSDESGLNVLFGAANGYVSAKDEKGTICEFLDGRGRGGGVLILNEIEEAHSKVITRFMELFDKGLVRCGDGHERHLGRSLIVMTSNKNTDRIISYDSIRGMSQTELDRRLSQITPEQLKKAFSQKSSYMQDDSRVVKSAVLERVDKFYFASPLLREQAVRVAELEVDKYVVDHNRQSSQKLIADPSFAEVLTGAFYNESLGARQLRTSVQQSASNAVGHFKKVHGFASETLEISAKLHPSQKTVSFITVRDLASGEEITVDGPRVAVGNRLLDKEFRDRLVNLETALKKEVFGQDEAIRALVSTIKARYLRGGKENLAAGFLLGSTGTGKSQLGKSLARILFGREEALELFEMGKVKTKYDLGDIFSPAKGVIGSTEPGQLEQFLIQYPDGGVLLFDEMSNAGADDPKIKDLVAKQFYSMIQEGIYRSPSGEVYDLSKYIVILTGNDGEEIFRGLSSDSMLEEAYKDAVKNPEKVRDILRGAGFTNAFLGRLGFVELMRPTLTPLKVLIARKLLNQWRESVQKEQPLNIHWDADFEEQIGRYLFTPEAGARSIEQFISGVLGQAVADQVLALDWDDMIANGRRADVHVRVQIDAAKKPFYEGDKPFENRAVLKVGEKEFEFTSKAYFMPQVHIDIARATAFHEIAHLVTSFPKITGKKAIKITIVPEKLGDLPTLGYAQYRSVPTRTEANYDFLVAHLAGLLAGSEAEKMIGLARTTGRGNDAKRVGEFARRLILDHHLMPELDAAHAFTGPDGDTLKNLPKSLLDRYEKFVADAIRDGRALAIKTLKRNWHVVEAGAALLLEHGNLNEDEIDRLLARGEESPVSFAQYLRMKMGRKFETKLDVNGIVANPCEEALNSGR